VGVPRGLAHSGILCVPGAGLTNFETAIEATTTKYTTQDPGHDTQIQLVEKTGHNTRCKTTGVPSSKHQKRKSVLFQAYYVNFAKIRVISMK
jgi:hypothetical protein